MAGQNEKNLAQGDLKEKSGRVGENNWKSWGASTTNSFDEGIS